jgi:hypothetical protein
VSAAAVILAAATGSNTTSGAPLTLIFPVAFVIVVVGIWSLALRSGRPRRRP